MGDLNEAFREKLKDVVDEVKTRIGKFLEDAQKKNELPAVLDIKETSDFIVSSWQGALLQTKVSKSIAPLKIFDKMIFESLLKR
jgi:TetR/AcrR family transcriptional repressor of nem operon